MVSLQKESEWEKEFVEKGAALEHERWAKWQAYMHSKFVEHSDGKGDFVCLPVEFYKRWERQIATVYSELTEPEKESDREQVRPYIPFVQESVSNRENEIAEEVEKKVKTDFTNAWKVMVTKKENHHEKCSWRVAGMLCDCAGQDVFIETTKLFRDSVLQIIKH